MKRSTANAYSVFVFSLIYIISGISHYITTNKFMPISTGIIISALGAGFYFALIYSYYFKKNNK